MSKSTDRMNSGGSFEQRQSSIAFHKRGDTPSLEFTETEKRRSLPLLSPFFMSQVKEEPHNRPRGRGSEEEAWGTHGDVLRLCT